MWFYIHLGITLLQINPFEPSELKLENGICTTEFSKVIYQIYLQYPAGYLLLELSGRIPGNLFFCI